VVAVSFFRDNRVEVDVLGAPVGAGTFENILGKIYTGLGIAKQKAIRHAERTAGEEKTA
jgi:hypothetical protein